MAHDAADGPVIRVQGLSKTYKVVGAAPTRAVDDVSFEVQRGECLGLVGESGSGKSTIAKIMVGLEHADGGEIDVCGRPRTKRASHAERLRRARELQMVFQDPMQSLDPRQSASACVLEVLRLHFNDRGQTALQARADELMDHVGLSERQRHAMPTNLSGGQRQRVAIARALAAEPEAIVLDEAVSALDVSIQAQILNLLADLQRDIGVAYLFISHDLSVMRQSCQRLIVLRRGEIVEGGDTDTVLDAPQHSYTQMLRAAAPSPGWTPQRRPASANT